MLAINLEDVVGVINTCKPQLILLGVLLGLCLAVVIAMAVVKSIKSPSVS